MNSRQKTQIHVSRFVGDGLRSRPDLAGSLLTLVAMYNASRAYAVVH